MIKVKNLNKYYNKGKSNQIHVINDTSLELPSSGLISFLGHSGSGKTTLLNVIGGLDKASGTILYDDLEINKYNMHKIDEFRSKHIGYVFQNYNLLKSETVYDNLRIALEVIGVTNLEEIDKRIEYTLKAVGMYKYRKKKAYALSGGQQQRVSIARALVKNCKIIIADEPTGNLDSNNTIEVMNILKKISKDTLVLMVTHETDIASFYSDYIFELKDGSIINQNDNSGDKTLKRDDSNTVYLADMNKKEYETEIGNIKIYSDTDDINPMDLDIIIKNGTVFINSKQGIKLANNSNLKIIHGHYEDISKHDVEDFTYDTSWYKDLKENKHFLKKFLLMLKTSFLSLKNVKKRIKFLYLSLACIGLVWAIAVVAITNSMVIDVSDSSYNENYNVITRYDYNHSSNDVVMEIIDNGLIDDGKILCETNINYRKFLTYNYEITYNSNVMVCYYDSKDVNIICGNEPKNDNELLISKSEADKIISNSNGALSYEGLINNDLLIGTEEYIIKGITDSDNKMIYSTINKYYYEINCGSSFSGYSDKPYWVMKEEFDYRFAKEEYFMDGSRIYDIYYGKDVDVNSSSNEALISKEEYESINKDLENYTIDVYGEIYKVVGVYEYPYKYSNMYILNKDVYNKGYDSSTNYFDPSCYEIVQGRLVKADNEVLVPLYSDLNVGDYWAGYIVVGKFVSDYYVMGKAIGSKLDSLKHKVNSYELILAINSDDINEINEFLLEEFNGGFKCNNMKQYMIDQKKISMQETTNIFTILSAVLAIVAGLFIYFIMRSRMISDIYNIGVYRSLGAKRGKIYFKHFIDNIVLATFTALIGYLLGIIGYNMIANMANDMLSSNILMKSNLLYFLGGICIYVFMILFGMLPIFTLLRKTPSEICTKYDI